MITSFIILCGIIILISLRNVKQRYTASFWGMMIGIYLLFIANISNTMTFSQYKILFDYEKILYDILLRFKVSVDSGKVLVIIGLSIFVVSLWNMIKLKKMQVYSLIIGLVIFFLINIPYTSEKLYLLKYENYTLEKIIVGLIILYNIAFLLLPICGIICTFIKRIRNGKIIYRRRQNMVILVAAIFFVLVYFYTIEFMQIKGYQIPDNVTDYSWYMSNYDTGLMVYLPYLLIINMAIAYILLEKYKIFGRLRFLSAAIEKRHMKILKSDLRPFLHSNKNYMMTLLALQYRAEKFYGTEQGREALLRIKQIVLEYEKKIEVCFKDYNCIENKNDCDLVEVVSQALEKIKKDSNEIKFTYNDEEKYIVWGNKEYLIEVVCNIVNNAIEAVEGKEHKLIEIELYKEEALSCIEVKDNGEGVSRKNIRKIFKPLMSTKQTFNNWGIGLYHVATIIKYHSGNVIVKSKVGTGTTMQVTLPSVV